MRVMKYTLISVVLFVVITIFFDNNTAEEDVRVAENTVFIPKNDADHTTENALYNDPRISFETEGTVVHAKCQGCHWKCSGEHER